MKQYAYIRVSSNDQNEQRQYDIIKSIGIPDKQIFVDKTSGKNFERNGWRNLVKVLTTGDVIHITSIDRMGRNYEEILRQWQVVTKEIGADIHIVDMPLLDTRRDKDLLGTLIVDIVLQLLSFVAQSERENIRRRQAEGIVSAKARGVKFGRPRKMMPSNFEEMAHKWMIGEIGFEELLGDMGVKKSTLYARLREYKGRYGGV